MIFVKKIQRKIAGLPLHKEFEWVCRVFEKEGSFGKLQTQFAKLLRLSIKEIRDCLETNRQRKIANLKRTARLRTACYLASSILKNDTNNLTLKQLQMELFRLYQRSNLGLKKIFGKEREAVLQEAEFLVCLYEQRAIGPRLLEETNYNLIDERRLRFYQAAYCQQRIKYLAKQTDLSVASYKERKQISCYYKKLAQLNKSLNPSLGRRLARVSAFYAIYRPGQSLKIQIKSLSRLLTKDATSFQQRHRDFVLIRARLQIVHGQSNPNFSQGLKDIDKALKALKTIKYYSKREYVFLSTWSTFVKQLVKKLEKTSTPVIHHGKLEPPNLLIKPKFKLRSELAQISYLSADIKAFIRSVNKKTVCDLHNTELDRILHKLYEENFLLNQREAFRALIGFMQKYYRQLSFSKIEEAF